MAGFSSSSANTQSRIFRNNGNGSFTDVTTAIGFWSGTSISVSGFAPRFADMTGDRYPELILSADFGTSRYFRNDADGTFTDVTVAIGAGDDENGMGHTVGDYNRDGYLDWYVTSIYKPTIGWTGNKLYWNSATDQLTAAPGSYGAADGGYGWGAVSVDIDHDGWEDIVETNGDNGTPEFLNEPSYVYMNDGDGTFSDASAAVAMPVRADFGLKLIDLDLDGDLDLIHHDGSVTRLYRNAAGVFDAGTIIAEDSTPTFGYGLAACDMNIDGFEDLYIANNDTGTGTGVPKLLVNVNGTLMPSAVQREFVADSDDLVDYNDLFSCADVSGDGRPDTVARWGDGYRLLRGAVPLSTRIRIRVLGAGGERNQQGRIVRVVPQDTPNRVMTRVIDSGSGLRSQGGYDLQFGGPWPGTYDVTVEFAAGSVTTTAEPGDDLTIYSDGRVETGLR